MAALDTGPCDSTQSPSPASLATYIDHTLLTPDATDPAFDQLCQEARTWGFHAVCVNSSRITYVCDRLKDTDVRVCSVVGFPLGQMASRAKACEAEIAIQAGADELDMVMNVGELKSGNLKHVEIDIQTVRAATPGDRILKVIIETSLLTDDEKISACRIAKQAGADFVKTCSGFAGGGATSEDIALMRETVGPELGVKASGGLRNYQQAVAMLAAGATRIGASSSVAIVTGNQGENTY